MRWTSQAAGQDRVSNLRVCRRYPPVLATLAMLTLSAEVEGSRVVRGKMSDEEFQRVAAQARQLSQAPWVALDASPAGSTERLIGSAFAEVMRRRQIRLVIVDHRPPEEDLRRLRWRRGNGVSPALLTFGPTSNERTSRLRPLPAVIGDGRVPRANLPRARRVTRTPTLCYLDPPGPGER